MGAGLPGSGVRGRSQCWVDAYRLVAKRRFLSAVRQVHYLVPLSIRNQGERAQLRKLGNKRHQDCSAQSPRGFVIKRVLIVHGNFYKRSFLRIG